jgi:hypothetical protein
MSLAAFKRRIHEGQRVTVVNHIHPALSGERTVHAMQTKGFKTMPEGKDTPWFVAWPRKGEWRVEGNTLHFVDIENPDKIFASYTFHFETEEETSVRTRYRVTWQRTGTEESRTEDCIVDSAQMTRPGDPEQREQLLRTMLAKRSMPIGQMEPESITLQDVVPVCNCENSELSSLCDFAQDGGHRFHLETSNSYAGCEIVQDRASDRILGIVSNTGASP